MLRRELQSPAAQEGEVPRISKMDLNSAFTGESDRVLRCGIELTRRFSYYATESPTVC